MVQNTTSRRGRPQTFDRKTVIERAMIAFWANGIGATTLGQLEVATGVDRSTIYNSFGGKTGLLDLATAEYLRQGQESLLAPLTDGSSGLDDIDRFLQLLSNQHAATDRPNGCLIINGMSNPECSEIASIYLSAIRDGLAAALTRSNSVDGTRPTLNEARTESLTAAVVGVNLTHRADGPAALAMMAGLRSLVRGWRIN